MSDLPAYLVDEMRTLVGTAGSVENATELLIDAADGLRVINEVEQIAAIEWASCQTSQGVRRLLHGLRPGMTEHEAVRLLEWNGWPLSCHLMLTAGPRATYGLLSPSDRPIERGDRFTTAFGIWGALTCRAGFVVETADELPEPIRDYVDRLVAPYFAAIAEWYGAMRIGVTGAELHDDHRPSPRRPVLRHLPQPGAPAPPRRVGQLADRGRLEHRAALRDGVPGRRHPGDRDRVLHDEHRGWHRPRRCWAAGSLRRAIPRSVGPHRAASRIHGGPARHRPSSRRSAALEPARPPAAVPPSPGPRHDPRAMSRRPTMSMPVDRVSLTR